MAFITAEDTKQHRRISDGHAKPSTKHSDVGNINR